jgi:pheromone shutdown-related protein TraB
MDTARLSVVGTSHISRESADVVVRAIRRIAPAIVCLELDPKRFYSLMHPQKAHFSFLGIRRMGLKGWLFMVFAGWAEKKLGKLAGASPGWEMLSAVRECRKNNIKIALVDQDVEVTMKRLSGAITWKEKLRFVFDLASAPFSRRKFVFDLKKAPGNDLVELLLKDALEKYPNVYRVLVKERNSVIARNIAKVLKENAGNVVAVVGAGHEKEVKRILSQSIDAVNA